MSEQVQLLNLIFTLFVQFLISSHHALRQVGTFSRCLLLVGDHGAGLSNAVFMPTGSTVVELTHAACGRHCGDYFRPVSELSGVNHRRVAAANLTASDPHFGSLLDDSIATSLRATGIAAGSNGLLDTKQEF